MAKLVTDGGTRRERDCSSEISESILQGRFTYDKSLGPFFDGALIVNVDRRFLEHFAENACRHQEGRGKLVCLDLKAFTTACRRGIAVQDGFRELLVDVDFTRNVMGMKLQMRNFMGNCESLSIGMMH